MSAIVVKLFFSCVSCRVFPGGLLVTRACVVCSPFCTGSFCRSGVGVWVLK